MRATITVRRHRSAPSSNLVGFETVELLESLPGISDIRVEREDPCKAVVSYRWQPKGEREPAVANVLERLGIQVL
jgi:hypothetical protein